jgi:ABC-type lipoprotein export system ATPase subunit
VPLELKAVSHRYGRDRAPVLRDLSLAIADDDVVALMGPSGSGKTTLLSILGLLTAPAAGTVALDGRPVPRRGAALARVRASTFAWIFQTVNVLGRRTALDNAALGLLARGEERARAERRAAAALAAVGLADHATRPVQALSGGELQRVCIARAIASAPRFILADEPTAQLDRRSADTVIEALVANRPRGTAVVIATHDPEVASRCSRVLRLRDGRLDGGTG